METEQNGAVQYKFLVLGYVVIKGKKKSTNPSRPVGCLFVSQPSVVPRLTGASLSLLRNAIVLLAKVSHVRRKRSDFGKTWDVAGVGFCRKNAGFLQARPILQPSFCSFLKNSERIASSRGHSFASR